MDTLPIRELQGLDLERANEVYDELDFVRSEPATHRTFGGFDGTRLVALARLARFEDGGVEVGGIWTHSTQRGRGWAHRMVAHVLRHVPEDRPCHLIAFERLVELYRACGFAPVPSDGDLPPSIRGKLATCRQREGEGRYGPTTLMRRDPEGA